MDIIEFWETVEHNYNEQQKCGFCWKTYAPLQEAGLTLIKPADGEECCVAMIITHYSVSSGSEINTNTGLISKQWCDHIFTIYIVKNSNLGVNIHNEQPGHPKSEGLYETIIKPLKDCFGCGNEIDLCALGYDFEIKRWMMTAVTRKEDFNWTGWRIEGIFRQ